ncbi:hypothetical protein OQA88_807 [Cercophora sp. LCS_1]
MSIEATFQSAIATSKINGAHVLATNSASTFTYTHLPGTRTLLSGEKRPHTPDDILYLASATKLITTISALQCVDAGLLSLNTPLTSTLPELASQQVLTPSGALEPGKNEITLAMLLSHTSGAAYDFLTPRLAEYRAAHPGVEGKRPVEQAFDYPLAFHPGEGWMYGPGLDWAGRAVERVSRMRLGEWVRQRICEPLGIEKRGVQFFPVEGEDVRQRMVDLHPQDPEGVGKAVLGGGGEMNRRSEGDFGGHGLFMTAEGYLKVLKSVLGNDGVLLSKETGELLVRDQVREEARCVFREALEGPIGPFFRVGTEAGMDVGYGLGGLLMNESVEGWYGKGTFTWGGGLTFAWFVDRENDLCALAAVQAVLPVDGKVVEELKQTFRKDVYRKYAAWKEGKV